MKKFIALGTECLEFKEAVVEAKGRQLNIFQLFDLLPNDSALG
jgi:hypothetical protein